MMISATATRPLPIDPDRWKRHQLFRNPFGELTRDERAELAIVDMDRFEPLIGQPRSAVQFVGDCGRGKTTRMLAIARRFADASYVYLPEGGPTPAIPDGNPVMIDEAQRLPRVIRNGIFAAGVSVVLATHKDLSGSLRRHGYQVHTDRIGGGNHSTLIRKILNARIRASMCGADSARMVSLDEAEALHQQFGSDVRAIEHYLYQRIQAQVMQHGEVRFID
ncbi:hypothetical protein Poly51_43180 [Rubripirellula tenax]|uniref:AAA+ ATPase domain-containing protein n=1 Tax=Rubripirellula tenax TaxID=2528015 RepID=A0A5C6ERK2_9BACT|nr:hypothetical protein [Rubripirellula tenax]TWU51024.1 hypothetical protein Poly51_43180 [Rubripirellula tenax]